MTGISLGSIFLLNNLKAIILNNKEMKLEVFLKKNHRLNSQAKGKIIIP